MTRSWPFQWNQIGVQTRRAVGPVVGEVGRVRRLQQLPRGHIFEEFEGSLLWSGHGDLRPFVGAAHRLSRLRPEMSIAPGGSLIACPCPAACRAATRASRRPRSPASASPSAAPARRTHRSAARSPSGRPASTSCSIDVLWAPTFSAPSMRCSIEIRSRSPSFSAISAASRIICAASSRVGRPLADLDQGATGERADRVQRQVAQRLDPDVRPDVGQHPRREPGRRSTPGRAQ